MPNQIIAARSRALQNACGESWSRLVAQEVLGMRFQSAARQTRHAERRTSLIGSRFDDLSRKLAERRTRRDVAKAAGGLALGAAAIGGMTLAPEGAAAAPKKSIGAGCKTNADCASNICGARHTRQAGICQPAQTCVNQGWKTGDADWSCPSGFRMPTTDEWSLVAPCVTSSDQSLFGDFNDVAVSVGGCNCKWNDDWCSLPSIETIREGRACGDYAQLQICVKN